MAVLATDNFNRADNLNLGTSWDVLTGEAEWVIISNQISPTSGGGTDATESNNSVTWPNDQYSQAKFVACLYGGGAADGVGIGVAVRCATAARTYYRCITAGSTANGTTIAKLIAGSYTALGSQAASWVANDIIYMSAVGTTLQVKRNGTNLFSATDASIASGRAGISYSSASTSFILDDWEGGDFVQAFTPLRSSVFTYQTVQRASVY